MEGHDDKPDERQKGAGEESWFHCFPLDVIDVS